MLKALTWAEKDVIISIMFYPTVNVKENTLSIMHSDTGLKMKGFNEANSPYEIKTFTKSGFGATFRYDFNNIYTLFGQVFTFKDFINFIQTYSWQRKFFRENVLMI